MILDTFYRVEHPPWGIDLGFHAFPDGFLALFVKAHLESLQKRKKNVPKMIILSW